MTKPTPKMTMLKVWMQAATVQEQETLAKQAGTTRGHLYQVSSGYRAFSPEKAADIERATAVMHRASKGRLPRLYRTDLAEACAKCEFARRCLGPIAVRSEFPIVTEDDFGKNEQTD